MSTIKYYYFSREHLSMWKITDSENPIYGIYEVVLRTLKL